MNQIATIETNKAERLMKALCNHFARKINAHYEGNKGYIEFVGMGKCEITATASSLTLQVDAENEDNLSRLKQVVADHLLRFMPGETIQISWKEPTTI